MVKPEISEEYLRRRLGTGSALPEHVHHALEELPFRDLASVLDTDEVLAAAIAFDRFRRRIGPRFYDYVGANGLYEIFRKIFSTRMSTDTGDRITNVFAWLNSGGRLRRLLRDETLGELHRDLNPYSGQKNLGERLASVDGEEFRAALVAYPLDWLFPGPYRTRARRERDTKGFRGMSFMTTDYPRDSDRIARDYVREDIRILNGLPRSVDDRFILAGSGVRREPEQVSLFG